MEECGPGLANPVFQLFLDWQIESPRRNVQLAVERRSDGALVGSCAVRMQGCAAGEAEFGIELARVCWGRHGYATEISRAMIGWAFSQLDIGALIAHTAPGKEAVARLAIWAGFERESCSDKQVWRLQRSS